MKKIDLSINNGILQNLDSEINWLTEVFPSLSKTILEQLAQATKTDEIFAIQTLVIAPLVSPDQNSDSGKLLQELHDSFNTIAGGFLMLNRTQWKNYFSSLTGKKNLLDKKDQSRLM